MSFHLACSRIDVIDWRIHVRDSRLDGVGFLIGRSAGNLATDAHLAGDIAIEHGAALGTYDRDFARFPGLRLECLPPGCTIAASKAASI